MKIKKDKLLKGYRTNIRDLRDKLTVKNGTVKHLMEAVRNLNEETKLIEEHIKRWAVLIKKIEAEYAEEIETGNSTAEELGLEG
jgi:predicted  nucleic acid-binding Zn-ribbon protein